ncbi:MAG TPA: HAD family hydrolase [Thermoguttaceae bacterium]|mgnify:CR=1 FL=1|nr:HAD family hydrolase [Thermoguttaceae bacterium]
MEKGNCFGLAGLLLDADDVLYDASAWRRWLVQVLGRFGVEGADVCLLRGWEQEYAPDVYRGRRRFAEALEAFLLAIGLRRAQIEELLAASQGRLRVLADSVRAMPGVKTTLQRLWEAGLKMAVVVNSASPAAEIRAQLERLGVGEFFRAIVSSWDLGVPKPAPLPYWTALRELGLRPEEAGFVGHDAQELAGAAAVGLRTIAFNYDQDAQADVFLHRFEELLDVIGIGVKYAAAG